MISALIFLKEFRKMDQDNINDCSLNMVSKYIFALNQGFKTISSKQNLLAESQKASESFSYS